MDFKNEKQKEDRFFPRSSPCHVWTSVVYLMLITVTIERRSNWIPRNLHDPGKSLEKHKKRWRNCSESPLRPCTAMNRGGERFRPILNARSFSFSAIAKVKLKAPSHAGRENTAGWSNNARPGSFRADICAGLFVEPAATAPKGAHLKKRWINAVPVRF
jgi:hypothetical protein